MRGVVLPDGSWAPLLSPKGYEAYGCYKRYMLAGGCRKSSKTITLANKAVRHCWENDGAVVGLVARTLRKVKAGTWRDICNYVIPGWEAGGFGLKVIKGPVMDPATRMEYIILTNMHGGTSTMELHSLDVEDDVATKFKNTRFSMLWMIEGDEFEQDNTFRVLNDQLRMLAMPYEIHQFVVDANPPENGDEHWLHDLFWKAEDPKSKFHRDDWKEKFARFEFGLEDNPFLDPRERKELIENYKHDPIKYARYIEGKWVKDSASGIFDDVFLPNIHLIGDCTGPEAEKWTRLVPGPESSTLIAAADLGDLNHAISFLAPWINDQEQVCYSVFDELVSIGNKITLFELARQWKDKVEYWTNWMQKSYDIKVPIQWRFWGDSALWNDRASTGSNDARTIYEESGGLIRMVQVPKGRNSVGMRIALVKRLLVGKRLFVSAHCEWNEGWLRYLKPPRGRGSKGEWIAPNQKWRHSFDATSYGLRAEAPAEFGMSNEPTTAVDAAFINL